MNDSHIEFLKMIVPIIAVVVSYLLGLAASKVITKSLLRKKFIIITTAKF